jgi:hypothetical protein
MYIFCTSLIYLFFKLIIESVCINNEVAKPHPFILKTIVKILKPYIVKYSKE